MIAFRDTLPQVLWHNQRLIPLSQGWLAESLEFSATKAGVSQWPYAPQVAQAILSHLEESCESPVLKPAQLEEMVRESLRGIGFPQIAAVSKMVAPRVSISLPDLARMTTGHEMLFFQALSGRLAEALQYRVRGVRLEGLRECVKMLDQAPRWRTTCKQLSDEIIVFTRRYLAKGRQRGLELLIR